MGMKKVLIYFPEWKLLPKGGPAGYLYNLKNGLADVPNDDLEISFYHNGAKGIEDNSELRSRVPKRIKDIRRLYKFKKYLKRKLPADESLFEYDAIHFHKTEDLYFNRDFLEKYKGKVILTSHTPCAPYQELIGRLNPIDYKRHKKKIDNLVKIEEYAFQRADYIIFPCEQAEEPYYNTWESYPEIRKKEKYRYLPNGIVGCQAKISRNEYRKQHGIPEDAFVISYAGRHNEIKGYGDLKKIGETVLKDKNVYFLIAGREGPLYKLENDRWIEIGWTTDPHSLIASSDMFLLPNHETYFDLILLEVISLGIPVLMSYTGGNKYFEKFGSKALKFYKSIDEAVGKIEEFRAMSSVERKLSGESLIELFDSNFTTDIFTRNYIEILKEILEVCTI